MKTYNKVECDDADDNDVMVVVLSDSLIFSHCSASVINICLLLTDTWLYLTLGLILCITYSCYKIQQSYLDLLI